MREHCRFNKNPSKSIASLSQRNALGNTKNANAIFPIKTAENLACHINGPVIVTLKCASKRKTRMAITKSPWKDIHLIPLQMVFLLSWVLVHSFTSHQTHPYCLPIYPSNPNMVHNPLEKERGRVVTITFL